MSRYEFVVQLGLDGIVAGSGISQSTVEPNLAVENLHQTWDLKNKTLPSNISAVYKLNHLLEEKYQIKE